jgi:hypothetical protein
MLRKFYEERGVDLVHRWAEVEEKFKEDPLFKQSEPLEQIT